MINPGMRKESPQGSWPEQSAQKEGMMVPRMFPIEVLEYQTPMMRPRLWGREVEGRRERGGRRGREEGGGGGGKAEVEEGGGGGKGEGGEGEGEGRGRERRGGGGEGRREQCMKREVALCPYLCFPNH
jgi:hypothetical protein